MTSRERIFAALDYRPVDRVPLRVAPAAGGLHEHGQKLLDLIRASHHDFGPLDGVTLPVAPPATDYDPDGSYHAFRTDAWGTRWEYRIPFIWGHPIAWPVADLAVDDPRLHRLADRILEHLHAHAARAIATGADAVIVGDDFGTTTALIMSPATWRRFFKPRYAEVFAPLRRAGVRIFFHMQHGSPSQVRDYVRRTVEAMHTLDGGSWLYIEIGPGFPWPNVEALFAVAAELRR